VILSTPHFERKMRSAVWCKAKLYGKSTTAESGGTCPPRPDFVSLRPPWLRRRPRWRLCPPKFSMPRQGRGLRIEMPAEVSVRSNYRIRQRRHTVPSTREHSVEGRETHGEEAKAQASMAEGTNGCMADHHRDGGASRPLTTSSDLPLAGAETDHGRRTLLTTLY
jgi:hypothetical protein